MDFDKTLQLIIKAGFFALFFAVPLLFLPNTYELFEFNKMVFVYAVTILITSAWTMRMILARKVIFQTSFFTLPFLLFLLVVVITSINSIDTHTSIWGYYSRYHGGLLSIICYVLLALAFQSNNIIGKTKPEGKIVMLLLVSAVITAGYGFLQHFGIDKHIWVQDVQNRVFSTLGQPNWLAAYLNALIFLPLALSIRERGLKKWLFIIIYLFFYLVILFTKSKSGLAGFWAGLVIFYFLAYLKKGKKILLTLFLNIIIFALAVYLFFPSAFLKIEKTLLDQKQQSNVITLESGAKARIGGSPTSDIRRTVWKGAINIWEKNKFFGSGNETFAYAYFQNRPVEHNLNSEWDFLYNKAHNEYLNTLANNGLVGLTLMFCALLTWPLWLLVRTKKFYFPIIIIVSAGILMLMINPFGFLTTLINTIFIYQPIIFPLAVSLISALWLTAVLIYFWQKKNNQYSPKPSMLELGLFAGYITILLTNFYGFSVVVVGLFSFLFPAISFSLVKDKIKIQDKTNLVSSEIELWRQGLVFVVLALFLLLESKVYAIWSADKLFSLGKSYYEAGQYSSAFEILAEAENKNNSEPIIKAQLAEAAAGLAYYYSLAESEKTAEEKELTDNLTALAIEKNNEALSISPYQINYYKSLAKTYLTLANLDSKYYEDAVKTLENASQIAPTDPKMLLNIGLIAQKIGQDDKAEQVYRKAIELKPDYEQGYVYLARLFKETEPEKAKEIFLQMNERVYPPNKEALEFLNQYEKN